ncbi:hypothetical protein J2X36_002104 [Methylobacterium sp. BE186]|uniref:hypothetical protein n=1 Tax=Methylobacterium sp. BE186 TaxID=2817715 RepID=UPI002866000D|nr:hypothetical protein [Methylobacterium sp. BE186]MDR7037357.1 hypothetical protein [Methylobacterium sp. BE186]
MTNPSSPAPDTTGLREEIGAFFRKRLVGYCPDWPTRAAEWTDALLALPPLASLSERLKAAEEERDAAIKARESAEECASRYYRCMDRRADRIMELTEEKVAAEARASSLAQSVEAALTEAPKPASIRLMAGEMTGQEMRTAQAVANGIAAKVRSALSQETTDAQG